MRNDAFDALKQERAEGQYPETLNETKLARKMHNSKLGVINSKHIE